MSDEYVFAKASNTQVMLDPYEKVEKMQEVKPLVGLTFPPVTDWKDGRNETENAIINTCSDIAKLLVEKNRSYGNSALEPSNIFAKASASEQIATRIDDKLNRILKGKEFNQEDTVLDLIGYLVLYRIALSQENI